MKQATDNPTPARPAPTVAVVAEILRLLTASMPDICLLHGGDDLGSQLWRGDVDLLVAGDARRFFEQLQSSAAALGFFPVLQIPRIFNTAEIDLIFSRAESWTAVLIDREGVIINFDVVFVDRRPDFSTEPPLLGVARVGEDVEGVYVALKRIRKGERRPEIWRGVAAKLQANEALLQKSLGSTLAEELVSILGRNDVPSPAMLRRARLASRFRRVVSGGLPYVAARGIVVGARRLMHPPGAFVVLSGVDGAGKSTVADQLIEWSPFRRVRHLHSRPGALKPLGWYLGRKAATGGDPHQPQPSSPAGSAARVLYLWSDFVFGYFVRIWPVKLRGGFVVCERWWWDLYVDPRRHRLSPSPRLVLALGRLVPRADLFFVLDAPSSTILRRKGELTAEEIERQRFAWTHLSRLVPGLTVVDAAATTRSVSAYVEDAVVERQGSVLSEPGRPWH